MLHTKSLAEHDTKNAKVAIFSRLSRLATEAERKLIGLFIVTKCGYAPSVSYKLR